MHIIRLRSFEYKLLLQFNKSDSIVNIELKIEIIKILFRAFFFITLVKCLLGLSTGVIINMSIQQIRYPANKV